MTARRTKEAAATAVKGQKDDPTRGATSGGPDQVCHREGSDLRLVT